MEVDKTSLQCLVVVVHLPSKINGESEQQERAKFLLNSLNQKIENMKKNHNIENVIIVGDFNMNPYEKALNDISALKTTNCINSPKEISIYEEKKTLYYNPSYHLLGNLFKKVKGTYFHNHNWSVIDQVIINKEMIKYFNDEEFDIILLPKNKLIGSKGRPRKEISDHLPIKFKIGG